MDFLALAEHCAPAVHPMTMAAVARVESGFNPYAIGVVGGWLVRQPTGRDEAIATAKSLEQQGYNFSVGLGQVNRHNLARYGLDYDTAFDGCQNLKAGASILSECYARAARTIKSEQSALRAAFSCYYSGNFSTGFRDGYVAKVVGSNASPPPGVGSVPRVVAARAREARGIAVMPLRATTPSPLVPSEAQSALLF